MCKSPVHTHFRCYSLCPSGGIGARLIELLGADLGPNPAESLTDEIAEFLTGERPVAEVDRILTTVLFTDIVGSAERAAELGDHNWRTLLDTHDATVREQLRRFRGREVNTTGYGFVACFDGPAGPFAVDKRSLRQPSRSESGSGTGLHTGECDVRDDDLGGLAVHIAARVAASAAPNEVLVSGTVKDLVAALGIEFENRGEHEFKGVPGSWRLLAATM